MKVKELRQILTTCDPDAIVMTATLDDNGNIEMVEASAIKHERTGDVEIYPETIEPDN